MVAKWAERRMNWIAKPAIATIKCDSGYGSNEIWAQRRGQIGLLERIDLVQLAVIGRAELFIQNGFVDTARDRYLLCRYNTSAGEANVPIICK